MFLTSFFCSSLSLEIKQSYLIAMFYCLLVWSFVQGYKKNKAFFKTIIISFIITVFCLAIGLISIRTSQPLKDVLPVTFLMGTCPLIHASGYYYAKFIVNAQNKILLMIFLVALLMVLLFLLTAVLLHFS